MASRPARLLLSGLIAATVSLSGCSGLFFFPDQTTYITPDRLNLEYSNIFINTADGEVLHGWWLPAATDQPGEGGVAQADTAKGTVYFLHGNAQNISSHIMNVAWLPAEGYNVFALDYRGYGRSTGAPDIEGALHDVESGMRWLIQQPQTQGKPLFLLGQSLGGGLALPLAAEWQLRNEQPPLAGLILDGTFAGFRAIARDKLASFWLTWALQAPLSWTIPGEYEGTDYIANISPTPLLLIHSVRDGIIPFANGETLFQAAQQPKQFLQTDTPHAATFALPEYQQSLIDFLDRTSRL
ncbi:MAG: alpha/beta hydrolase [Marinobacter sp.]